MSALTTLDGLDDGTDIALQRNGSTIERWKFQDNKFVNKDGSALDTFFFTGLLAEGRIYLGDFSPPEPGEWFAPVDSDRWNLLTLQTDGIKTQCAQFSRGSFYQWIEYEDLPVRFRRIAAPDWAGPQFLAMTNRAWSLHQQVEAMQKGERQRRNARESVTYAIDYLNRAREQLG